MNRNRTPIAAAAALLAAIVPRDELVQPEVVDPFRNRGGDAAQDQRLELLPYR